MRGRSARHGRLVAAISAFALVLPWAVVGAPAPAQAGPGDGAVTVNVLRDFFHDGTVHPEDVGQAGIPVTIADDAGTQITVVTNAAGVAAFTPATSALLGGKYRVSAVIPPALAYLQPAPAGGPAPAFSSHVAFVNVSGGVNATVTMGVTDPGDYAQANPDLVTPAHTFSGTTRETPSTRAVVRWPYTRRGTTPVPTTIATYAQVGTVYGLATRARDGLVFAGAFAKRHTDYGPLGSGGIYVLNGTGGAANFANLTNAGSTAHGADPNHDSPFFDVPGKQGLGDLELSADGNTLYAVNLATKSLVVFDVTNTTATPSGLATPTSTVAIPDPGCVGGAWRPFGLGRNDGKIYVGGVCDAETSNQRANLRAYVLAYDPAAGSMTPVFNHVLSFKRGPNYDNPGNNRSGAFFWHPWSGVFNSANWHSSIGTNNWNHAEPELSDIEFDRDGSLMLGFRDRFADQLGSGGLGVNPNDDARYFGHGTAGALERACRNADGTWSWQGENGCPNNNTKARPNKKSKDPAVIEYYAGSWTQLNDSTHEEVAQGGLAFAPRFGEVTSTTLDPTRTANTGGVGFFDNKTGDYDSADTKGYLINPQGTFGNLNNPAGRFGKANGLGDLELIAAAAPVQIGNRVWVDVDGDGVQDPGEAPLPGATVHLRQGNTVVATKVTGPTGQYYFGTADKLAPNTAYTLRFDYTTATIPGSPPPSAVRWTGKDGGGNDAVDSDVDPATGMVPVTTGPPGYVNHTLDAGIVVAANELGDYVWIDADRDGVQDPTETPVEDVPVMVRDANGNPVDTVFTDATGKYTFTDLPDGTYDVCFNLAELPDAVEDYVPTTKDAGGDDTKDSDADQTTACTAQVTLGAGKRTNTTLDLGLVPPLNSLGDYVWIDADKDGVQDPTETPVQGVVASAKNAAGDVVGTDTTDADGKYLIGNLPDGAYTVCFDLANLPAAVDDHTVTTKDAGGNDAADSDADQATGCTGPVTLGLGARQNLTLDLGLVSPPNSLGDYVWADVDKDGVQDSSEAPVPGVVVTAKNAAGQSVGTDTTDAAGKYLIGNLPDGSFTVCFGLSSVPAQFSDYVPTTPNVGNDDAVDSDGDPATLCTEPVELGIGKRKNLTLDLGLVPPVSRIGDYAWIDADKDGVQDPTETPVPGVVVTVRSGDTVVGTDTTDEEGKYLVSDLPNGTYTVCFDLANLPAAVDDFTPTTRNASADDEVDSDADSATGCTEPVTVGPGQRENFSLDLGLVAPVNTLGDYVWIDADKDGAQDATETPVQGVGVTARNADGEVVGSDTTDAEGKYLVENLPDGTYHVCFDLANLPAAVDDYTVTIANAGGNDTTDSDASPASGCTATVPLGVNGRQNFSLDLGLVAPVNRLGDFVWVDADKDGAQDDGEKPVPGVKATVKDPQGTVVGTDTTDAGGKYLVEGLPDGRYTVCFDVADLPDAVDDYTVTTRNAGDDVKDSDADSATGCTEPVELGVNKRVNLTVDAGLVAPPNRLGDRVWSDANRDGVQDDGEPGVPGVPVTVRSGDTVVGTDTTDGDGNYAVEDLPDGTYTVCFDFSNLPAPYAGYIVTAPNAVGDDEADSDASPATACTGPVELGVNKRENLTLDAGIRPEGNQVTGGAWYDRDKDGVRDPGETSMQGVPVVLRDGDGDVIRTGRTGPDGRITFLDVPDGRFQLCYGLRELPKPYTDATLTKPNAGADSVDSDAAVPAGCTELVYVGPGDRAKRVDAGFVRPRSSGLPVTGASLLGIAGLGIVLVSTGFMLVIAALRRRRRA